MENEEVIKIVIAEGDYAEAYAPFPGSKEENDEKIKRGMLTRLGMKKEEIDRVIDSIEVVPDRGGADGMFDDGPYTPVKLVKTIYKEPPTISIPDPELELEPEKEPSKEPRQTMLQQYYGDRKAEARRVKTFDRFKSHITKKMIDTYDENETKRKIEVYTIEDYEGKAQDSNELLLDGYQTRLERLSRAHQKDFSPYKREFRRLKTSAIKEIMIKYEEMHRLNPEEAEKFKKTAMETISDFNSPEFERDAIQALIDQDTEFIETNNHTYNSRQNTAENLKTLGKDGEKSVKAQISDEQSFAQKFGLKAMNTMISIRNHTKVPVNKALGTWVASPIYRALMGVKQAKSKGPVNVDGYMITPMEDILATSQKHSRGMFKNKPSHRYHARKDYFIEEEKRALEKKMQEEKNNGKEPRTTVGSLIKLAILPRVRAITGYKEGNVAILNAGLHDLEEATAERNSQMAHKRLTMINSMKRIASYEKEIDDLRSLARVTKDPVEKEKIEATIKQRKLWKAKLEGRLIETERTEIDSVSTDAVSMSQHDKANKANMTTVIRGFKTAARIAAGAYLSKYLYEEVLKKGKTPDTKEWIPPEEIEKEVTETITKTVPGMDKADVGNITLEDIYDKGSGLLTYDAYGGNQISDNTSFFRGLAFEYQGKLFSGSDGKGFDPTVLTDVKIDQVIDKDTTLVSLVQEILEDKLGKQFTPDQVNDLIVSGQISGFDIWRSTSDTGVPMGWLNASEIVPDIISSGSHTITEEITKTVIETIPGRWEIIPGDEYFYKVTQLNPAVLAAEFGLAASEIADLNEFLRFTRSQEDIQMRSTKKLMRMAKENEKARAAKTEKRVAEEEKAREEGKESEKGKKKFDIQGTSRSDVPKTEKRRNIKPFQRSNKGKVRYYAHESEAMRRATEMEAERREGVTVFEKFTGSRKDDLNSGYDENALKTNERFETPVLNEKEGEEK